jgi:hypothetical protein
MRITLNLDDDIVRLLKENINDDNAVNDPRFRGCAEAAMHQLRDRLRHRQ